MNPTLKNLLASCAGFIVMMVMNMGLVILLGSIFPPPEGVDPNDVKSINNNLYRYSFFQLIMPFIAHAGGTLTGTFTAAKMANSKKVLVVMILATVHFFGGVMMVSMLNNSPMWFIVLDLGAAYFPMAWLGYKLSK